MKNYDICMQCHHVMYDDMLVSETTYNKITNDKSIILSHGVCDSEICGLEFAMKTSGILDAKEELPLENEYLFHEMIEILDKQ